jgi:hypothetical protein
LAPQANLVELHVVGSDISLWWWCSGGHFVYFRKAAS